MQRVALLVSIFILWSCHSDHKDIPEEKMIDILVDMQIAEQVIREYDIEDRDSISNLLIQSLLKVHNVTRSQLDTNLYLYQLDLAQYTSLADSVMRRLERMSKLATQELQAVHKNQNEEGAAE